VTPEASLIDVQGAAGNTRFVSSGDDVDQFRTQLMEEAERLISVQIDNCSGAPLEA
jgi:hypothetical protein